MGIEEKIKTVKDLYNKRYEITEGGDAERKQLKNGLKLYLKAYDIVKDNLKEIAKKNIMEADNLLFNIAGVYQALADLKYPQIYDKENIVPENTKEREYLWVAIKWLDELIKFYPKDWEAYYTLGTHLCRVERYKEAIPYLEKAVKLNPTHDTEKNLDYAKRRAKPEKHYNETNTWGLDHIVTGPIC